MRYRMKQKIWSWGDDFLIRDGSGEPVYLVDGKVFSWGDKLSLQDMHGRELAFIEQELLSFMPRYRIHRGGGACAEVVKEWSWFRKRFTLDVPGPNDYAISGDFWAYEYAFERRGRTVAAVSKSFWSWSDSYGVDIAEGEDDIMILATAVVIDLVQHDDERD